MNDVSVGDRIGTDVHLEYAVHPRPRFGEHWGLPRLDRLHTLIAQHPERHRELFAMILAQQPHLLRIPLDSDGERDPRWINPFLPGLDTAALYAFITKRNPATYLEIGSGHSTRVVRRAIEDHGLRTRIVSIDPQPRAICDELCDEIVRSPLEDAELSAFESLTSGDVLFVDNSHCAFQNSDVTVVFLEVLPRLRAGVLVGIHDIWLPDDYPQEWSNRWYNEQYLLAAFLLGGADSVDILFPAWHVSTSARFADQMQALWSAPQLTGVQTHGHAFWMQIRP